MTTDSPAILERLVREYDLGWMIDMYAPPEEAIVILRSAPMQFFRNQKSLEAESHERTRAGL